MNIGTRNSADPVITGITQAFKKAARLAQSFSSDSSAQQLAQSLVYNQFNVEEAYNDGRTRYGVAYSEAFSGDASIIKELQAVKLTLLELAETLRDYNEDPDQFQEPPFSTLQKTSDDAKDEVLAILEKLNQSLPQTLPVPQKRLSAPPTPPPKDHFYQNGVGSTSKQNCEGVKEREPAQSIKSAAQLAIPVIDTIARSPSPKSARRTAYISDPESMESPQASSPVDRRAANLSNPESVVKKEEWISDWIPKEEVDQRININEAWLHQRKLSRIAFRASSITSDYSSSTSPRASLASSPRRPPPAPPHFSREEFSTAAPAVNSEDFSRYSLGRLNPPNLIWHYTENKILDLNKPEQKSLADVKPLFDRRGASEEVFRFGTSRSSGESRDPEDNRSPRTTSLPVVVHGNEDDIQTVADRRRTVYPSQVYEDGLMLVSESEPASSISTKSTEDKSLTITPNASFYQFGGFCPGALMLQNSQAGAFKMCKKPSGNYNATVSGRCVKCAYEVSWKSMEKDRLNDLSGIFSHPSGLRWRQRFLQKCHLSAKNTDEAMFSCIFCIEQGETLEVHDATVFFSVQQLFRHLEKHIDIPRKEVKVNVVSGLDGIEGHDFDIHFLDKGWRRQEEMESVVKKLDGLATGIACASHRPRSSGFKIRDPDGAVTLQFAKGARIIGIAFPPHFSGQWISGYHDGVKAHFPAQLTHLTPPISEDVLMSPKSLLTATARWDFKPAKDSSNWLSFSKKERITNIGFAYQEHWCWSGQNGKGKWGLFPKVFVDGLIGDGVLGEERGKGLGVPAGHRRSTSKSGGVLGLGGFSWNGHKYSSSPG